MRITLGAAKLTIGLAGLLLALPVAAQEASETPAGYWTSPEDLPPIDISNTQTSQQMGYRAAAEGVPEHKGARETGPVPTVYYNFDLNHDYGAHPNPGARQDSEPAALSKVPDSLAVTYLGISGVQWGLTPGVKLFTEYHRVSSPATNLGPKEGGRALVAGVRWKFRNAE